MLATEQDALLPHDSKRAPEISTNSHPPSLHDDPEDLAPVPEQDPVTTLRVLLFRVILPGLGLLLVAAFSLTVVIDALLPGGIHMPHSRPSTIKERVDKILTETPLIDGHNDLAILIRAFYNNHIYGENFTTPFEEGGMLGHVDLPRLKKGKNGGAFWSAFAPCPANGSDFSTENMLPSVDFTLQQIDVLHRLQAMYPTHFSSPHINSSTALSTFRKSQLISPIGIEGLHQIGNSASTLRLFHSLGVRYATLTHNCHNIFADSALSEAPPSLDHPHGGIRVATPKWHGVSPLGQKLIKEMNRIGMIVDLAHVSQDTMRDVLGAFPEKWEGSLAPPIYSHSSAYSICPHPRNVPDDILHLVAAKRGLVMVNFSPDFISCNNDGNDSENGVPTFYPGNATLAQVVKHVTHIGELIGYDYVGLGSDFDGIERVPEGLEDVGDYPKLVKELLKAGVGDENVGKVVGGNVLRVWGEVDGVAESMQREGVVPMEDELPGLGVGG